MLVHISTPTNSEYEFLFNHTFSNSELFISSISKKYEVSFQFAFLEFFVSMLG